VELVDEGKTASAPRVLIGQPGSEALIKFNLSGKI
jgi:hypothetical protein